MGGGQKQVRDWIAAAGVWGVEHGTVGTGKARPAFTVLVAAGILPVGFREITGKMPAPPRM